MQGTVSNVDNVWLLLCAILVLLMQGGFLCIESGFTRSKNAINVALKNAIDLLITVMLFWLVGFAIMFGNSHGGHNSWYFADFSNASLFQCSFFFFQLTFCSTAITIVSGAIAERAKFSAYICIAIAVSAFIYPMFGQWVWSSSFEGTGDWLAQMGFVDFAGSTVVHGVGGWVALAAVLVIGPRKDRFDPKGNPREIPASNLPFAMLGVLLFLVGWLGFNGGSALTLDQNTGVIVVNTIVAAAAGGSLSCATFLSGIKRPGISELILNGTLAGLVSITAACHAVSTPEAAFIGAVGAVIYRSSSNLLLYLRIDDAVGAIPVHLMAGIWGTLAVAFFGDPERLGTGLSFGSQLYSQLVGIVVCGAFTFTTTLLILWTINRFTPLRVSHEDEEEGLNVSEHGTPTELHALLESMREHQHSGDVSKPVPVEPFTEVGIIAKQYNAVIYALDQAIQKVKNILNDMRDGVVTFDQRGIIYHLNPCAESMFGVSSDEIKGRDIGTLLTAGTNSSEKETTTSENFLKKVDLSNKKSIYELMGCRSSGELFEVEMTAGSSEDQQGSLFTAVIRDVAEKKRVEEELFRHAQWSHATLDAIQEAVITCDNKGIISSMNPFGESIVGDDESRLKGHHVDDVLNFVKPDGKTFLLSQQLESGYQYESDLILTGSKNYHAVVVVKFSEMFDKNKEKLGYVIVLHDVSVTRHLNERLEYEASHDSLTGLLNRKAFEQELVLSIHQAHNRMNQHMLLYLDLDQFKIVNDTGGPQCGDELIKASSLMIQEVARQFDVVARMGADEFAFLLKHCPLEKGLKLAEELRHKFQSFRFQWKEHTFSMSVSIGVIEINKDSRDVMDILKLSQAACLTAKEEGRNRVHLYTHEDTSVSERRDAMFWASKVQTAIDENRFTLYCQAISDAKNIQNVHHYEVLIRMLDEDGNLVPPSAFIPAAERYHLMSVIDLYVLENTLDFMSYLKKIGGLEVGYAINLSGNSIGDEAFLEKMESIIKQHQDILQYVCFEITETSAILNQSVATTFINRVKSLGCTFALDDFGSGLSSFAYLKTLPVDYLKIDGVFVRDLETNTVSQEMVKSIHNVAHTMGLETIAEFVENAGILKILSDIDVDFVQGYHIHKPSPLLDVESYKKA